MPRDRLNKVDFKIDPNSIPNTDEGNLKLYHELGLLKIDYDEAPNKATLARYEAVLGILEKRELHVDYEEESEIDKATHEPSEVIQKPLPHPSSGESREDFISRCMSAQSGEDKPQDQKLAICDSKWRDTQKSSEFASNDEAE